MRMEGVNMYKMEWDVLILHRHEKEGFQVLPSRVVIG